MTSGNVIVQTHGLTKQYGNTTALDHVDLTIPNGNNPPGQGDNAVLFSGV